MKGFFHSTEEKNKNIKKSKSIKIIGCESCGLYKDCLSPKMKPTGEGKKNILIIAEAPGRNEDRKGIQLIGEAGRKLRQILNEIDIDLDKDCIKTNAIICRPLENETPNNKQINACRKNLINTIEKYKPEKIITLGSTALKSLIGERLSILKIGKWTGHQIPDQFYKTWVYPTYHPSYLIRNPDDKALHNLFKNHLQNAINHDEEFNDYSDDKSYVGIIESSYAAQIFIGGILPGSTIAIDIETTGLKPHREGHFIKTIAIAINEYKSIAFPLFGDRGFRIVLKKLLRNEKIKKIAHGLKFESSWFKNYLKTETKSWYWDTMIAAHIIDNRGGITGLKDQVYFNFGIDNYNDKVESYLKSDKKGANEFNKIDECDLDELLLYNGFDSLYTYRLYKKQIKQMSVDDISAYNFFHGGLEELSIIENNGICIDIDFYKKKSEFLFSKMKILEKKILESEEVRVWEKRKDKKKYKNKIFDFNSSTQLRILLYDFLDIIPVKKTKKGNVSVDYEALEKLQNDYEFVKSILDWRKLQKLKDTYLAGFIREEVDNKIHTVFNLNIARSYRPSTSNPNFANIPKHDKKAQRICRSGIIPSKGNILFEVDYSGIEVRVSACYHKDKVMVNYINNPEFDMHRDSAMDLFLMEKEEVDKNTRFLAKSDFVFAQFYGDYYKKCAENLWRNSDGCIKNHLKKKGIKTYSKFEKHVQRIEDIFWNEKFVGYSKWKKDTWRDYQKKGYIKSLTGFVYGNYMDRKQVNNYPIQGSAFHCLLWSLIQINRYLRKNKYETKIINQVYDDILFDMVPDEKEELKPIIKKIMTKDIREKFKWIIVPLNIDMEVSEINGNWYKMLEEDKLGVNI